MFLFIKFFHIFSLSCSTSCTYKWDYIISPWYFKIFKLLQMSHWTSRRRVAGVCFSPSWSAFKDFFLQIQFNCLIHRLMYNFSGYENNFFLQFFIKNLITVVKAWYKMSSMNHIMNNITRFSFYPVKSRRLTLTPLLLNYKLDGIMEIKFDIILNTLMFL